METTQEKFDLDGKAMRILITDDSKLLRKKLRVELERFGCEVLEAEDGKEAVMKTLQEKPDGVFLTSGIIEGRQDEVQSALEKNGFEIVNHRCEEEWHCFECRA